MVAVLEPILQTLWDGSPALRNGRSAALSLLQLLPPTFGNYPSAVVAVLELHTLWSHLSAMLALPENLHPLLGNRLSAVMAVLWLPSHALMKSLSAVMAVLELLLSTLQDGFLSMVSVLVIRALASTSYFW